MTVTEELSPLNLFLSVRTKRTWTPLSIYLTALVVVLFIGGGLFFLFRGLNSWTELIDVSRISTRDLLLMSDEDFDKASYMGFEHEGLIWFGAINILIGILIVVGVFLSRPRWRQEDLPDV